MYSYESLLTFCLSEEDRQRRLRSNDRIEAVLNIVSIFPNTCTRVTLSLVCLSMAVVIRLQGLRITAGSQDIRKFFTGLKIPDGGVHIIGGEKEEAFIIFASDEDARRAMTRSGGQIRGGSVTLLLSSKAEMQTVFEKSAINAELEKKRNLEDNARHARRSTESDSNKRPASKVDMSPPLRQKRPNSNEDAPNVVSPCVFLKGLPFNVSQREIVDFFKGLHIVDVVLLKNATGRNNGMGLVKFSCTAEVSEALKRDRDYIGSRYVEICPTTEEDWRRSTGRTPVWGNPGGDRFERRRSPLRGPMRSQSPIGQRGSSPNDEFCIMVENLSFAVETEDIKRLFHHARLDDDQILFMNFDDRKSRSAFVLFKTMREFREATEEETKPFFNRLIHIRPISREKMVAIMESQKMDISPCGNSRRSRSNERTSSNPRDHSDTEKCLLVQNLPFDVRKMEVMDLFVGMNLSDDDVHLLRDDTGSGTGKALVLFHSDSAAMKALSLDGQRFLGAKLALKYVSRAHMRELIAGPQQRFNEFQGADEECSDFRGSRGANMPMNAGPQNYGGYNSAGHPFDRGNGARSSGGPPRHNFSEPTCVKLVNLPFQIKIEEIYDFCHGYRILPGSISLQYDRGGAFKGSATVVFETREEAAIAVEELNGRPIGSRKIQLLFV
ncbi:RNA binding motif protein 12Bb [Syngnathus scovelli]|uniref:RNA binding motif protein 12Bb n=1 Tax=Syngnathus scovelli TaxID=161590 RepID=UPI0021107971|nr:RNA binding motif protein 12Bb [Syngnathus scovelli]